MDSASGVPAHEEGYFHFLARESRLVLRWVVLLSAAATVLTMFTLFYWAILPAIVLLISYALLLFANEAESLSHQPGDPGDEAPAVGGEGAAMEYLAPEEVERREVGRAVEKRLTRTVLEILLGVGVLALIIAVALGIAYGNWTYLALGGLVLFAYMLLVAAPLWLGWVEDEAEEETHRVEQEFHPGRG
jgi:fatty acid desaturase